MEILEKFGAYISAIVIIIFQVVKMLINNRKMKSKFDEVSKPALDSVVNSIDYEKLAKNCIEVLDKKMKEKSNEKN